ncbi:MAG: hypothetical protein JEZ11_16630 [Desulfobacterales bacterium]|nr:hypothetical protein [Desulfobacterales bacterium]
MDGNTRCLVWCGIVVLGMSLIGGCTAAKTISGKGPPAVPIVIPEQARIAIVEIQPELFGPTMHPLREPLVLPNLILVDPPRVETRFRDTDDLVDNMAKQSPATLYLTIEPETITEMVYNPRPVPIRIVIRYVPSGQRNGKTALVPQIEPVSEIEYQNRCLRTAYKLSLYDEKGSLKGQTLIRSTDFQPCPKTSFKDIHFDDFQYVMAWLRTNLRSK